MSVISLLDLNNLMIEKQASNLSLAFESGISIGSIANARLGKPIKLYSAIVILQTLNTKKFKYQKRGPKK